MNENHWLVYEFLKHIYMRTGYIPTFSEIRGNFPDMRAAVIQEGIEEFRLTVGKFEKGA